MLNVAPCDFFVHVPLTRTMPASVHRTHSSEPAALHDRTLVTLDADGADTPKGHDRQSRFNVAQRLAKVMGWTFGGDHDTGVAYADPLYFVPHDALLASKADELGIRGPEFLFGGVVQHAFIATKAITHPLVDRNAVAPIGWSHAFSQWAGDSVLRGFSTFSPADAKRAAAMLVREGPVRIKCVSGIGGSGQHVAGNAHEVDAVLMAIDPGEFESSGVTIEQHLDEDVTFSVGRVECGGETIAYCGTQRTTRNSQGHEVYGGSTLEVVRGGFAALLDSDLSSERRAAVELAHTYDAAAFTAYPDAFASRRNYDVLFGRDANARIRAGVLEQSWRIGGASGAEVLAFAALRRDRARTRVCCATVEIYDAAHEVPAGAFVYYRGTDHHGGPLIKYAIEFDVQNP